MSQKITATAAAAAATAVDAAGVAYEHITIALPAPDISKGKVSRNSLEKRHQSMAHLGDLAFHHLVI